MNLTNKIAIVTGASSGFGVGIARELINAGAKVWVVARSADKLEKVAKQIGAKAIVADVTKSEDWDKLISQVMTEDKTIDILVNNAGGAISTEEVGQQTDDQIRESIGLNLTSAIIGSSRVSTIMKAQKSGTIIQMSSICSKQCWPGWSVYGAAKAGLEQFSRGLYTELRPHNVRAVFITPSWGATDFGKTANLPDPESSLEEKMIQPKDIGQLVLSICTLPDHLVIPEVTVLPMVQEIVPY
ncbi:MAG: NADP-dependent 3-hydroxy acid dehydrogenase YdfG [Cyclobacteriaceae bacterium]|jgi:NADP-dependent 3-hydroxy acid dehydrogenase YdfG